MTDSMHRELSLRKGGERFVFRYWSGQEPEVLAELAAMAEDESCRLDWFDAAILSFEMGRETGNRSDMCLR